MKKLILLLLVLGASAMHAATIKFNNRTGSPLNANVFLPGGSSVMRNVPAGETTQSVSGCWVGIVLSAKTPGIRSARILSEKTLGIQMTCPQKTIEISVSDNQLKAAQR